MASLNVTSVQGFGMILLTAVVAGILLALTNEFVLNPLKDKITQATA